MAEVARGARITRDQRAALAGMLLTQAGNLVEFWSEYTASEPELADVDAHTAAVVLGVWLRRLPGDGWDTRLVEPGT